MVILDHEYRSFFFFLNEGNVHTFLKTQECSKKEVCHLLKLANTLKVWQWFCIGTFNSTPTRYWLYSAKAMFETLNHTVTNCRMNHMLVFECEVVTSWCESKLVFLFSDLLHQVIVALALLPLATGTTKRECSGMPCT